jgi:hypothetical protein
MLTRDGRWTVPGFSSALIASRTVVTITACI